MDKLTIAIYSRKSKFVEGSESIESQIEMCKEYIKRNFKNVEDILIYEDEGFSGGNIDRPQFKQMIKDAENKMFNVVICYRLDRISRNVLDFSSVISKLERLDISFVSIREQFDTSTPMGRAMMYISSVFAQLERETIAERIRDNMMELSKTGKWLGGREPLGYKKIGIGKNAVLEKNNDVEFVKMIYEKYLEFDSTVKVQKYTILNGFRNSKGKIYSFTSVKFILSNPVYCIADGTFYEYAKDNNMIICNAKDEFETNKKYGVMCFNRHNEQKNAVTKKDSKEWIVSIGQHEGIIDSKTWIQVQNRLKINSNKFPREGTAQNALLSGLIRCKNCGSPLATIANYRNNKRTQHYYKCKTKAVSNGTLCNIKNVNGQEADKQVLDGLLRFEEDPKLIDSLFAEHENELNSNSINEEIETIETHININKKDIEKLTEKLIYTENSVASKYIVSKIEKLDEEIKELNDKTISLKRKQNESKLQQVNKQVFKDNVKYLKNNLHNLNTEELKRIIRNCISVIYWDGEILKAKPRI